MAKLLTNFMLPSWDRVCGLFLCTGSLSFSETYSLFIFCPQLWTSNPASTPFLSLRSAEALLTDKEIALAALEAQASASQIV